MTTLQTVQKFVAQEIPGFEIRFKNESWFMRLIGVMILFFNPAFMRDYTTTLFGKVYVPSREWLAAKGDAFAETLAHEYVHLEDARRFPVLFEVSYLFPQILAVFSLLAFGAFWDPSYLWFLIFLGFLAPIPSPWRTYWERRGYAMSLLWLGKVQGLPIPEEPDSAVGKWYVNQFSGWAYYRMCPEGWARAWYARTVKAVAQAPDGWELTYRRLLEHVQAAKGG